MQPPRSIPYRDLMYFAHAFAPAPCGAFAPTGGAAGKAARPQARQKALKVMRVRVSWMPGIVCTFWFTKWPMSVPGST